MDPEALLQEKAILFSKYKECTIEQQNALKVEDLEGITEKGKEKDALAKRIEEIDLLMADDKVDQTFLEPLMREVLELEESISQELTRMKSGLVVESSSLRTGQRAIKQYLQK